MIGEDRIQQSLVL